MVAEVSVPDQTPSLHNPTEGSSQLSVCLPVNLDVIFFPLLTVERIYDGGPDGY